MSATRKRILITGAVLVAAGAGGAVALAGSGDDERATGPEAEAAAAAAVKIAGGGRAEGVERDAEGRRVWEVEVTRPDGTTLEVDLDAALKQVAGERDDDEGGAADDDD